MVKYELWNASFQPSNFAKRIFIGRIFYCLLYFKLKFKFLSRQIFDFQKFHYLNWFFSQKENLVFHWNVLWSSFATLLDWDVFEWDLFVWKIDTNNEKVKFIKDSGCLQKAVFDHLSCFRIGIFKNVIEHRWIIECSSNNRISFNWISTKGTPIELSLCYLVELCRKTFKRLYRKMFFNYVFSTGNDFMKLLIHLKGYKEA